MHSKEKIENHTSTCSLLTKLSSEEKAGLQYIGGYVLHKLHNKHVNTKKSPESEQAISILKAGKARDQDSIQSQRLTSSLNRGVFFEAYLKSVKHQTLVFFWSFSQPQLKRIEDFISKKYRNLRVQ